MPGLKISIALQLGDQKCEDEMHIYPGFSGALISWKAAMGLGILPPYYPNLLPVCKVSRQLSQLEFKATVSAGCQIATSEEIMQEFPSVFDNQIRAMEGETFHITLVDNVTPFCVKASQSVPFAYRDKLKEELNLLQE